MKKIIHISFDKYDNQLEEKFKNLSKIKSNLLKQEEIEKIKNPWLMMGIGSVFDCALKNIKFFRTCLIGLKCFNCSKNKESNIQDILHCLGITFSMLLK